MRMNRVLAKVLITLCMSCLLLFDLFQTGTKAEGTGKFNMSYIYFGDVSTYVSYVDRTNGSLNEISPDYFNLNSDGTLKLTSKISQSFIDEMHKRGIKVCPFLSNHWNKQTGIKALQNRWVLAQQIADAVVQYNLDGVCVDIENMDETHRDIYTDFVRILRNKLPQGKSLSVAVAANPKGSTKGWQGSYDYKALAAYSDYLMLMTYDEHFQGSKAGPVAGLPFVEASIKYALQRVPNDKIVLGIPFYGRCWKNGNTYGGYGLSLVTINELIKKFNGQVTFDTASQSPKAVFTIKAGSPIIYADSTRLSAGTYTVWFENERSIAQKLKLVHKYNLKGTGSWSLGQETADTWEYYKYYLNGYYFTDTRGHWAENDIMQIWSKGWIKGVSETQFMPDESLTRAQAAALLVRALGLESEEPGEMVFKDISNHWAKREILIAAKHNIIEGVGDGLFNPDEVVTREQIAVMMDRILTNLGEVDDLRNLYWDVTRKSCPWSYESILRMTYFDIVNGYPGGFFGPKDKTTRAQMAVLMNTVSKYIENHSIL